VHDEFLEAVGKVEAGLLVRAEADLGHGPVASESASHSVVDSCVRRGVPWALLQLGASLPPYRSDWKRTNLAVLFLTILLRRRGVDFTIKQYLY
jgi:hypothetical protein